MTKQKKECPEGDAEAAAVVAYLRAHPWFFVEHSDLLADLVVPHISGDAVSLVERQISVMREKYRRLQNKYQELVSIARENDDLERRLYQLAPKLCEGKNPRAVLDCLYQGLGNDFKADEVTVKLFSAPRRAKDQGQSEFVGKDWPQQTLFEEIMKSGQPFCGRLETAQKTALFGEGGQQLGSAVVAPLAGRNWQGILAVASYDPRRYYQGMGVDFMARVGIIASLSLQPWVAD
jgi:uncharacterized protein YigA (DUF484 family)